MVGFNVTTNGAMEGSVDGCIVGAELGESEPIKVGTTEGAVDGLSEGAWLGSTVESIPEVVAISKTLIFLLPPIK